MQIKTKKSRKKLVISISLAILLIFVIATVVYATRQNDYQQKTSTPRVDNSADKKNKNSSQENGDSTAETSQPDASNNNDQPEEGFSTITEPSTQPIDISAELPIENAKFRIQSGGTPNTFNVTLYAIEGADYTLQLQRYKREVVDYLSSRTNSSNFVVNWTPEEASNL